MTNSEITLTKSQELALESLKDFVSSNTNKNSQHFRLTGYAGTGKSFLIAQFIKWANEQKKFSIIAASPTNKAAKNLKQIAYDNKIDVEVTTVAKLLGQQPEINKETGKEEFLTGDNVLAEYDIVIVDEFSMINKNIFNDIVCEVYGKKTKCIYVGDPAQLPPVGEKISVLAEHPYIKQSANLTEVVRYDGKIARIAETIRNEALFNKVLYPFITTDDATIECMEREKWLKLAINFFKSEDYKKNPNFVRLLVWRNRTARMLNSLVREGLYGTDAPDYVVGDRLIAKVPVFRPNTEKTSHKGFTQWQIMINSSEEVEVTGKAVWDIDKTYSWKYWLVPVRTDENAEIMLRILTEDGERSRQEVLKHFRESKKWKPYHHYLKLYDNVPHAYAITTHKAQGSSIDNVFIDTTDIKDCPDLQKIIYTALTRAKKTAFIPSIKI